MQPFDNMVDAIERERNRLIVERTLGLQALARGLECSLFFCLPAVQAQTRADAALGLIEQLEHFAGDVLPALEQQAVKGDATAIARAQRATTNIIRAVGGVSPFGDLVDDAEKLVRDIGNSAANAAKIGTGAIVAGLFVGAAFLVATSGRR